MAGTVQSAKNILAATELPVSDGWRISTPHAGDDELPRGRGDAAASRQLGSFLQQPSPPANHTQTDPQIGIVFAAGDTIAGNRGGRHGYGLMAGTGADEGWWRSSSSSPAWTRGKCWLASTPNGSGDADHPNIAKCSTAIAESILRHGTRQGVPITTYCDQNADARQRLELFVPVTRDPTRAQRIIHRDIKPSNVLTAVRRQTGAKVIDRRGESDGPPADRGDVAHWLRGRGGTNECHVARAGGFNQPT